MYPMNDKEQAKAARKATQYARDGMQHILDALVRGDIDITDVPRNIQNLAWQLDGYMQALDEQTPAPRKPRQRKA